MDTNDEKVPVPLPDIFYSLLVGAIEKGLSPDLIASIEAIDENENETEIESEQKETALSKKNKYTSFYMSWIASLKNVSTKSGITLTPGLLEATKALIHKLDSLPDSGELDKFVEEFVAFCGSEQVANSLEKIVSHSANVVNKEPKKNADEKYRVSIKYPDGTEIKIK